MEQVFISYGQYSRRIENIFRIEKQNNNEIIRIHGIVEGNYTLKLAAMMVSTSHFQYTCPQSNIKKVFSVEEILDGIDIELDLNKSTHKPIDIVYLTYKELFAEKYFCKLLRKYPNLKRLHGVKGLVKAFKLSAFLSKSDYYVLIDGDNDILDSFDLNNVQIPKEKNKLSLYMTKNPINDLVYGYGGIKVCPTENFRKIKDNKIDPIASGGIIGLEPIQETASVTRFNSTPFDSWKAGFREAVMLTAQMDNEIKMSSERIKNMVQIWKSKGSNRKYGEWAIKGAIQGEQYALIHKSNFDELFKINDPSWLKQMFKQQLLD